MSTGPKNGNDLAAAVNADMERIIQAFEPLRQALLRVVEEILRPQSVSRSHPEGEDVL